MAAGDLQGLSEGKGKKKNYREREQGRGRVCPTDMFANGLDSELSLAFSRQRFSRSPVCLCAHKCKEWMSVSWWEWMLGCWLRVGTSAFRCFICCLVWLLAIFKCSQCNLCGHCVWQSSSIVCTLAPAPARVRAADRRVEIK